MKIALSRPPTPVLCRRTSLYGHFVLSQHLANNVPFPPGFIDCFSLPASPNNPPPPADSFYLSPTLFLPDHDSPALASSPPSYPSCTKPALDAENPCRMHEYVTLCRNKSPEGREQPCPSVGVGIILFCRQVLPSRLLCRSACN